MGPSCILLSFMIFNIQFLKRSKTSFKASLLDMSRTTTWIPPPEFSSVPSSSITHLIILESNSDHYNQLIRLHIEHKSIPSAFPTSYLSLMKLALAKQSKPELTRIITMPGVLIAIGYCLMSQKISVSGILPSTSICGLIECSIILANEIVICNKSNKRLKTILNFKCFFLRFKDAYCSTFLQGYMLVL